MKVSGQVIVSDVQYDPGGRPKDIKYGNGLDVATGIENGRVKSILTTNVLDLSYAYDGADNVTKIANGAHGFVPSSEQYAAYDLLDRLGCVGSTSSLNCQVEASVDIAYKYDALGNRTDVIPKTGTPTNYVYDTGNTNLLMSSTGPNVPPLGLSASCASPGATCATLGWNLANFLESSSDGATYKYDGLGRRVRKKTSSADIVYHYDRNGRLIAETLASGAKLRDYYYVGDQLVAVDGCISANTPPCAGFEWYQTDVLGNVLARTDTGGQVIPASVARFQPWGELPAAATSALGGRLFNGNLATKARAFTTTAPDFIRRNWDALSVRIKLGVT